MAQARLGRAGRVIGRGHAGLIAFGLLALAPAVLWAQGRQEFAVRRQRMVDEEIVAAGVTNQRVIEVMRSTPRHEFVPLNQRNNAYFDMSLPIGHSQTISSPFIVAYMTEQIDPQKTDKVLEIGTGSGYQAAVLSPLVREVYTIEIVEPLGHKAAQTLKHLKYNNVYVKIGDGFKGWPERAPFDKIIVTCSPEKVPAPLVAQLREGGRMIIPLGERYQQYFFLLKKKGGQLVSEALRPTLFVPMTGEAEKHRDVKPEPTKPALRNGDFEDVEGDPPQLAGWYYQRQMTLVEDPKAPSGTKYVAFKNSEPGRGALALQGFAIDGRVIRELNVSLKVKGEDLHQGQSADELPMLAITFYDENRAMVGEGRLGPWRGSFDWKTVASPISVPTKAREGIIRIGLLGGVGRISLDAIKMAPSPQR
jgi:protein-L-isoaspartate(D-aspartate) O-methyltransferase